MDLKHGDKIKKISGYTFSTGDATATIDYIDGNKVYMVESGTWVGIGSIELVEPVGQFGSVISQLLEQEKELMKQLDKVQKAISALKELNK